MHPKTSNCGTIHCQDCSISQLCLPFSLDAGELESLDDIIRRRKPLQKNDELIKSGTALTSLYAVRSGSFKSYTLTDNGEDQIIGFHLPGDIIGFDAIQHQQHQSYSQALETSMLCEIPYNTLDQLSGVFPKLRQQVMRLMSNEIHHEHQMLMLLNKRTAEQRLAYFLLDLSYRFGERGFSTREFRLTMTRGDIGNYLGLTIETISRLFTRFQKEKLIDVQGKLVTILDQEALSEKGLIKVQELSA